VGEAMSSDKLNLTARAAGFAMAYDETAGPLARPWQLPLAPPVRAAEPISSPSTALVPFRADRPIFSWGFVGWNFWKTA
jgi:hypothetical protein